MAADLYSTARWQIARRRALRRDGSRCTIGRLLGGPCSHRLDVHHLVPVAEGGARFADENLLTACQRHHPMLEAFRRTVLDRAARPEPSVRCPHQHRHAEARRQCEARLARDLGRELVA